VSDEEATMQRIQALEHEQQGLRERESAGDGSDEVRVRLSALEVELDQCWDLLRQQRARRGAGLDPGDAQVRDPDTVENYRQ
jgi:hypothetical protein